MPSRCTSACWRGVISRLTQTKPFFLRRRASRAARRRRDRAARPSAARPPRPCRRCCAARRRRETILTSVASTSPLRSRMSGRAAAISAAGGAVQRRAARSASADIASRPPMAPNSPRKTTRRGRPGRCSCRRAGGTARGSAASCRRGRGAVARGGGRFGGGGRGRHRQPAVGVVGSSVVRGSARFSFGVVVGPRSPRRVDLVRSRLRRLGRAGRRAARAAAIAIGWRSRCRSTAAWSRSGRLRYCHSAFSTAIASRSRWMRTFSFATCSAQYRLSYLIE